MENNQMEKTESNDEMKFFAKKAGFVAGIALLLTVIKDIVELFTSMPLWIIVCYSLAMLAFFGLALGTKLLDKLFESEGITKFGDFLTVMSSAFFIIENLAIKCIGDSCDIEFKLVVIAIGGTILCGSIYLLHHNKHT